MNSTIKSCINNIGCKSILAHLLLSERGHDSKDMCKFCTRMITYESEHDDMSTLDDIYLETFSILEEDTRNAYEILRFKRISLNVHMTENRTNPSYRNRQIRNFGEIDFMAANHSVLIHNYLLTISSRVFLNSIFHEIVGIFIYRKLIDRDYLDKFKT